MDLDFTDEQEMLRETVRGVCEKHASLTVVREVEDDPIGYPESFWTQLADLGLLGLTIAEADGGSGMSMLDAAVVYEEFGRALAPSPHFVSSVLCGGVLERAGERRAAAGVAPEDRVRHRDPDAGVARAEWQLRATRRAAPRGCGRRRRSSSPARSATSASRARPTRSSCSRAPARAPPTSTCSSCRATRPASRSRSR